MPKRCERGHYDHIRVVVRKKRFKKHLILEKWEDFKNGQNWPPCMVYSPCKMVSLRQKSKMPKRCEKRLYDHIRVVFFLQKTAAKKYLIFAEWEDFENDQNWPPCIGSSSCKIVTLGQKLKMAQRCGKPILLAL